MDRIMEHGWGLDLDYWTIARIALARSLQLPSAPSPQAYPIMPSQERGVSLHPAQLIGESRSGDEDFSDVYRAMLSVYEGISLFGDDAAFHMVLQRHVRRGLATLSAEWMPDTNFDAYLLRELFPEPALDQDSDRAVDLGSQLSRLLTELGADARLVQTDEGPRITRFTYQLTQLDDFARVKRGEDKISFGLGLGEGAASVSGAAGERQIWIDIARTSSKWRNVEWADIKPCLSSAEAVAMSLAICLGTDVLGKPLLIDLVEAPHLFLGGTTGSGKSMTLHSILLSLLSAKKLPRLLLIDPKSVEFNGYKSLKNLEGGAILSSPADALKALNELIEEMDRRQKIFADLGVRDLEEAQEAGSDLTRIVVVIDELGDLFMQSDEIEIPLIRLAQKARSAGIHLVLATQRPEAATFPGMLRSSVPSRIALTVQKASESRIILDEGGAESLLGRGDMLVKLTGRQPIRGHGARIQPSDIAG
ncbi:FtsK/SpoIIIE domain-containing protein [Asticcacaulis sp. AC466]|uniref:FtsK/SpoIIIE domain-containing protein n=1 Tax=Asticcacaulis sp. AC466 TaxID=1282362 RepID=UPI00138AFB6C|nr:FtsK/SpoIIIE domain-containing protein [Asticcacaulis sp. AC466]